MSYKSVAGEMGSYCQLTVTFFFLVSPYNVVPQFIYLPSGQPPSYQLLPSPLCEVTLIELMLLESCNTKYVV